MIRRSEGGHSLRNLWRIGLADKYLKRHKTEINDMIKKAISEGVSSFATSFKVEIKSGSPDMERQYRFAIHHIIQNYPEKASLRTWSREEAMVPWVAVASEIGVSLLQNYLHL
jgi:hypothetical protein